MIMTLWAFLIRIVLLLAVAGVLLGTGVIIERYPYVCLALALVVAWRRLKRGSGSNWTHGSARVGGQRDAIRGNLLGDTGLIMGSAALINRPSKRQAVAALLWPFTSSEMACRTFLSAFFGSWWHSSQFVRLSKYCHIGTFSKTGGGKGVSLVLPNLLSYNGSVVAVDIKGELFKLSGQHRQRRFKHKLVRLDPLGIAGPAETSDTINPLDFIDEKANDFLDQCRALADQIVTRTGKEVDPHWCDSAMLIICAFIAFVCGCEADRSKRNLNTVRLFVTSRIRFSNAILVMQRETEACDGVISRLGHMLTWYMDRELGSVLTTVQRFTEFLDSPSIQRHTATSSFDPRILRTGKASLYLCLPHDKVKSLAPLQRMWISTVLNILSKDGTGERNPVLFMLDEVAHLGKVEAIETAVTLLRGMGIRLWFVFQSIDQVKTCYGESATTILDNIGTQQFFNITGYETAEALSKRIGDTTISICSINKTSSYSQPVGGGGQPGQQAGSSSSGSSATYSDTSRRLIRPEEILTLDENVSLLFHNNLPVMAVPLIRWYDHPAFRRGGTGKSRRIGLLAGLAAGFALFVSLAFMALATNLPDPVILQQRFRAASASFDSGEQLYTPAPEGYPLWQEPRNYGARRQIRPRW